MRARPGRDRSGRPSLVDRRRVSDLFLVAPSSWIFFRVGRRIDFLVEIFPRRGVIPRTHTSHQCLLSSRPPLSPASPPSRRRRSKYVIVVIYVSHRIASSSSSSSSSRARAPRGVCVWITGARIFARSRDIARGARRATRRWPRRGVGYMCMNIVFALDARAGRGGGVGGRGRRGFDRSMRMRGD